MANKTVVGRLGNVPEVRVAGSKHVAVFSVAETKRKFDRERNEWVDDFTIWHDCEAWTSPEAIGRLERGALVIIDAEERDGSYENRETGKTVRKIKLNVRTIGVVVRDAPAPRQDSGDSWTSGGTF